MTLCDSDDMVKLMGLAEFRRFLFDAIQMAGIWEVTDHEADGRHLFREGRRSLGLELLRKLDAAQPAPSPSGIPVLTAIQTLREAVQSTSKEKPVGRRDGPYADLRDGDE